MQNILFGVRSKPFFFLLTIFLICTLVAISQTTLESEKQFMNNIQKSAGNPSLDYAVWLLTESGNVFVMLPFSIILLIIRKTRKIGMILLILLVLSTILTGYIKCGVDRERPDFEYLGVEFPVEISRDTFALFCEGGFDASYPSGHAARSMIFAIILGYALSERFPRGAYLIFIYPAMISLSRLYVLQHFPMDVIGGTIIGVMLAGVMANRTKLYQIFDKSKS